MMKFSNLLIYLLLIITLYSCKTTSNVANNSNISGTEIIKYSKKYLGTPYKYAGTTSSGMDCSGLIYVSYNQFNKKVPRTSNGLAKIAKTINLDKVQPGNLLFFGQTKNKISHVGMVESIKDKEVFFIHSSTSKGVMISSLNDKYWKPRFIKAGIIE